MSELLKSGFIGVGEKTVDEIIKNWEGIGFLEGIDGYEKKGAALLLENVAKILIEMSSIYSYNGKFDTVIFPITRHIVSEVVKNGGENSEGMIYLLEAKYITKRSSEIFDDALEMYKKHFSSYSFDIEAEVAYWVSKMISMEYINSFKNKTIIDLGEGKYDIILKINYEQ